MTFKLPKLNFAFNALEPHIDALTMEIHYSKHHAGYTNKLNSAIEGTDLKNKNIEEILSAGILSAAVRNNGGGHANHSLFWSILTPNGASTPSGELADAIETSFGSYDAFKEKFAAAAATRGAAAGARQSPRAGRRQRAPPC